MATKMATNERTVYKARAIREGKWWALEAPEVPGAFSQARRLEQADEMLRDAVAIMLGDVPEDSFDLEWDVEWGTEFVHQRDLVTRYREVAEQLRLEADCAQRDLVHAALSSGYPMRDVAELLGVSFQRVGQIAKSEVPPREETEPIKKVADLMAALEKSIARAERLDRSRRGGRGRTRASA